MTQTHTLSNTTAAYLEAQIKQAIRSVELPDTNKPDTQQSLFHMFAGKVIRSTGDALIKPEERAFKDLYQSNLTTKTDHIDLEATGGFNLSAKVSAPRTSFDKDEFIKQIAAKYTIPRAELIALAAKTTKQSAAPVSFTVTT